jgi:NhaP-type Na+/H+ or K+/H+ antiporter
VIIGFVVQWALKKADENDLIDRHSPLSFYFAIALLCTGVGGALGVDESSSVSLPDTPSTEMTGSHRQTEDARLSTTMDLLLNLSYSFSSEQSFLGTPIMYQN